MKTQSFANILWVIVGLFVVSVIVQARILPAVQSAVNGVMAALR